MFTWVIIIVALLVFEIVRMELYGACLSVGALVGLILSALELPLYVQIPAAVIVGVILVFTVRPVGMKYMSRMKRQNRVLNLVGRDAIVICQIDNSAGVGVVSVGGKQWSARSNRPNAVIAEGELVTIVAMRNNTAIVDDKKRNSY